MAANGQLVFTDVDKVTFKGVGNTSNAVIDTTTGKIGVGVDSPDANLHVLGNCFVSTNFELGGTMTMGTVTVRAQHELSAITATGNTTPHTVEFQNAETSLVTTANVEVGGELTVAGNVAVDTDTLFVDSVNDRVGIGTTSPGRKLDVVGGPTKSDGFILGTSNNIYYPGCIYTDSNWGMLFRSAVSSPVEADFVFNDYSGSNMVVIKNGNVGIGTRADGPTKKLHVYTTASQSNSQLLLESADRYATMDMLDDSGGVQVQNDQGDLRLLTGFDASMANGSEAMRIKDNGNVGIGVTDPDTKLEVKFPSNDGSQPILSLIRDGTMSSTVGATFHAIDIKTQQAGYSPVTHASINLVNYNPSGSGQFGLSQPTRQDTGLGFSVIHDGSTVENALVISSIGNVGIGTDSPDTKLDVNGVIKSNVPSWNMWDVDTIAEGILNFSTNYLTPQNCTVTLSTGRVTMTVAGRYFMSFHGFTESDVAPGTGCQYYIRKNGSGVVRNYHTQPDRPGTQNFIYGAMGGITVIMDLAVNDYVDVSTNFAVHSGNGAGFCGFMIG